MSMWHATTHHHQPASTVPAWKPTRRPRQMQDRNCGRRRFIPDLTKTTSGLFQLLQAGLATAATVIFAWFMAAEESPFHAFVLFCISMLCSLAARFAWSGFLDARASRK